MGGEAKAKKGASLRSATENAKLIRMRLWMCSVSAAERPNHIQQHNGWRRNHAANGDA
jgi:hypothetical protein